MKGKVQELTKYTDEVIQGTQEYIPLGHIWTKYAPGPTKLFLLQVFKFITIRNQFRHNNIMEWEGGQYVIREVHMTMDRHTKILEVLCITTRKSTQG